jgi:hypothetical protein
MRKIRIIYIITALAMVLAACGGTDDTTTTETAAAAPETTVATEAPATTATTEAPATTTTTEAMVEIPEGTLASMAAGAPTLDGVADEAAWADAPGVTVAVAGGANAGAHDVTLKSVYSGDMVYFLVTEAGRRKLEATLES